MRGKVAISYFASNLNHVSQVTPDFLRLFRVEAWPEHSEGLGESADGDSEIVNQFGNADLPRFVDLKCKAIE